ncbi:MAG: hypothetical protein K8R53_08370 [Bacteroidales bacterium]|nr:hypothetical protein [Bacteroidales bacterium]
MKKIMQKTTIFFLVILPFLSISQEEKKFGIKFSGFVKTDIFFDSRQSVTARDGHFLLYPQNELLDINGDDINASAQFNILAIQTRLKGVISGPDVFGAKTSGLIEGAFFGNIRTDINGFRLRHAFVKLSWTGSELLVGQYWHPMFVTSCFPGTVSFNTGTPFQPFARNPQIRFTKKFGKVNLIGAAVSQVDFKDNGPLLPSTRYLINSGIPELNLRVEYKSDKIVAGAGVNYKTLLPRLSVNNSFGDTITMNYQSTEKVSGISFFGYFKIKTKPVTVKLYGISGQLMTSMTMLGGYAEKELVYEQVNNIPGVNTNITYTPISTMSTWIDVHTNGKTWQVGLFSGYSQNLGSNDSITGSYYSRGDKIKYAYRIAPRLTYSIKKFRVAPEIEYTVAAYGTPDIKGVVNDTKEVGNFRFLIGVYYFF